MKHSEVIASTVMVSLNKYKDKKWFTVRGIMFKNIIVYLLHTGSFPFSPWKQYLFFSVVDYHNINVITLVDKCFNLFSSVCNNITNGRFCLPLVIDISCRDWLNLIDLVCFVSFAISAVKIVMDVYDLEGIYCLPSKFLQKKKKKIFFCLSSFLKNLFFRFIDNLFFII